MKKINSYISRKIIKRASLDKNCFASWMKQYLSPREFYLIKQSEFHKLSINELKNSLRIILENLQIESDIELIEYLMRVNTKLSLILKFIRSGYVGKLKVNIKEKNQFFLQILSYRILQNKDLSLGNLTTLKIRNSEIGSFMIYAPVCPDYSYEYTSEGRYRYTFNSIGNGIGLVAKKAIFNINIIKKLSYDLVKLGFKINYKILIGDFEANEQNLRSLNETKSEFLKKVSKSCDVIERETGISTSLFTDFCDGLEGWKHSISQLKYVYRLNDFSDLKNLLPNINHEKKLISRLPLYKKWFGSNADYKDIFFNQTLEYILMGRLLSYNFLSNSILLASDHKAMKDYYNPFFEIDVISSSANY